MLQNLDGGKQEELIAISAEMLLPIRVRLELTVFLVATGIGSHAGRLLRLALSPVEGRPEDPLRGGTLRVLGTGQLQRPGQPLQLPLALPW